MNAAMFFSTNNMDPLMRSCKFILRRSVSSATGTRLLKEMRTPIKLTPNRMFKLTPTLRLAPSSRCAPYGAA